MSSIMCPIGAEQADLFPLELGKLQNLIFLHSSVVTDIKQSAPNMVKIYVTIRDEFHYGRFHNH